MSLITPIPQNTIIKAYSGIPWDNSLQDIRLFENESERQSFLAGHLKGQWNNCSIVSTGKSIKVEADYTNCMELNYLSWQNIREGETSRIFYAYITAVNYVNVNAVEIIYEVDWIQTYLFDFVFEESLVEREHVNDDIQGKYVLEEGLEIGEYIVDRQEYFDFKPAIVINVLRNEYMATITDNMYIPGRTNVYDIGKTLDMQALNNLLEQYNNVPERITTMFMGVKDMQPNDPDNPQSTFFYKSMVEIETTVFNDLASTSSADSYTPQNKKMLCYPYKLMTADNYNGSVNQYRWEDFNNVGVANFQIEGSAMPKPTMTFFPTDYRGVKSTAQERNTYEQESLWYDNFPCVNYVTDTFKAWVSQYGNSYAVETAAKIGLSVASMAESLGKGNVVQGLGSAFSAVETGINAYQEYNEHKIHSLQVHGNVSMAGLAYSRDAVGFRVTQYSIRKSRAMDIDKFFTRYGYRVEAVKIPNIRGRQNLNYVRCNGAIVAGNIAVDAKLQMERALNQGVTFWHVNNVGGTISTNPIIGGN